MQNTQKIEAMAAALKLQDFRFDSGRKKNPNEMNI
jgi:hypothetical protein